MTSRPKGTPASRSRVFSILNPFMRFMLHLPIKRMQERLLLLSFTGRKSGKHITLPLSYAEDGNGSLLIPGGGAWKVNLGPGRPIRVRLRGKELAADPEVIWDATEIERLLPRLFKHNPRAEDFVGVPIASDGKPDRAKLAQAIEDGFAIVRLRLKPDAR
jgi:hypothetical protein